jgi:hypothetical protein
MSYLACGMSETTANAESPYSSLSLTPDCILGGCHILFLPHPDFARLRGQVFNVFGPIALLPFPSSRQGLLLAAKLHGAYSSLQVPLPDLQGAGQSAGRILQERSFGSPQETDEKG